MGVTRRVAVSRLVALGYTVTCSRCGGGGRYSWNAIDGDRCFRCGGAGKTLQRITAEVVAQAVARIAAGELDGYFAANRARASIKARAEATWESYRASPICAAYDRLYLATRRTPGACLDSPEGRAQQLQNAAIACVEETRYARGLDPVEACRRIDEAHDVLRRVIAAWLAWRELDVTTPIGAPGDH